jgi:biopolymer transport protein ExbD
MGAKLSSGGGGGRHGLEISSEPNVIPFIDVMLVLLIIFMVAAPIATVDVEVEMPDSRNIPGKRPPKPTYVTLQQLENGQVQAFVMNDQVTMDELGVRTMEAVKVNDPTADNPYDETIYIRADGVTEYRNVMLVMNRLQDSGFTKMGLMALDKRR